MPKKTPVTGRPSKYKYDYCELLVQHMEAGYSFESFASKVRVNIDTLYEWCKVHPEFSEAKKEGYAHGMHYWEKVGIDGLYNETIRDGESMTVNRSINATIWIFNMKNRFGWKDRQEITATVTQEDKVSKEVEELKAWMNGLKKVE